jgi:hypothetical protein
MPSRRHEVLVAMLREQPELLSALVQKLTGHPLRPGLVPIDSTVRFVKTAEVRPDLLLADDEDWAIVEVQDKKDPDKQRRWLLATGVLFDQKQTLGDVIVITARKSVARWASTAAQAQTARGTRLALWPVVLYVGPDQIDDLLSEQTPSLAVVAAWAVSHRHGPEALRVVERAIEVTKVLPLDLQTAQRNAILGLLDERLTAWIKEMRMDPAKIPMSPSARRLIALLDQREGRAHAEGRTEGLAQGKRETLVKILSARGLLPTSEERAAIDGCTDPVRIDRWIIEAMTAASVSAILGAAKAPAAPRPRPRAAKTPKTAPRAKRRVKRA